MITCLAASRGTVRLRSADPSDPPLITPNYLSHDVHSDATAAHQDQATGGATDMATAVAGVRLCRAIARSASLGPLVVSELSPEPTLESEAELADYVRQVGESIYHPVGTCAMGPAAASGAAGDGEGHHGECATGVGAPVVCPRLQVHGVRGLRVVDASIMPTIVSGNTNAATVMIAERGAAFILEDAEDDAEDDYSGQLTV